MRALVVCAIGLVVAATIAVAFFLLGSRGESEAVQAPQLGLDMIPTGNTYDDGTNTMTAGAVDECLSTSLPGNNATHIHQAHLVIQNVEDLVGWQARLNYDGGKMRLQVV